MNLTVNQNIQLLFEDTKKEMVTPRFGTSKEKIYPEKVREKEKYSWIREENTLFGLTFKCVSAKVLFNGQNGANYG